MKRIVLIACTVGFAVPLFWGVAAFLLFNMKESAASRAFWTVVHITCPLWDLPGLWGSILMPILNAGLYGLIALLLSWFFKKTSAA